VLAAILAVVAFAKSPSIGRGVLALIVAGLGVLEAFFVARATLLPKYHGPIAIGSSFPAFAAQRANSAKFTDADIRGRPTVLTFFRGRW
jgi:cytochrome oxidase Cu insertion factor (SCO1/SenC/PrrC family)